MREMVTIKFWSERNGDEESARTVAVFPREAGEGRYSLADNHIEETLREYAEDDSDGLCDGCYDYGEPFIVKWPDGTTERWKVGVSYEPVFRASREREEAE